MAWSPPRFTGRVRSPTSGRFQRRTTQHGGAMLLWYGQEVGDRIEAEVVAAVAEVTNMAAEHARANHPWQNRTGAEEASIHAQEPIVVAGVVKGRWGADLPALFLELGTRKMPAYPFLRPAADATYPHLLGRLRA